MMAIKNCDISKNMPDTGIYQGVCRYRFSEGITHKKAPPMMHSLAGLFGA
jgi:hypothetical protein